MNTSVYLEEYEHFNSLSCHNANFTSS